MQSWVCSFAFIDLVRYSKAGHLIKYKREKEPEFSEVLTY
jgi:hypothetical protein